MINLFPNDAITIVGELSNSTSLGDVTTQLLPTGDYTILAFSWNGNDLGLQALLCGVTQIYHQAAKFTQNQYNVDLVQYQCQNSTVSWVQGIGTGTTKTFYSITYVPRLINSSSSNMATDTPMLNSCWYDEGVQYCNNPLSNIVGIELLALLFISVVCFIGYLWKKV